MELLHGTGRVGAWPWVGVRRPHTCLPALNTYSHDKLACVVLAYYFFLQSLHRASTTQASCGQKWVQVCHWAVNTSCAALH
jgi:hypothetical protein